MAGGLRDFLVSLDMSGYVNLFHMHGYDDEADIPHLTISDLQTVGVTNPMDIIVIHKAAQSYKQSAEYELFQWLRKHGLSHYYEGFIQSERVHLSDIAQLSLPDEDVYDELEVVLPGHRRRLERAVRALRKRQRTEERKDVDEGEVVTEGWWGYPPYLPQAKFPFLCVKATMQSTRQPDSQQDIDFMVDSGSDVSTLREALIQSLGLEAITTVRSCGAHGSVRTTMYCAYLIIGHSKLEIEVIGSSYDSLGSRVLRHFNHRIDCYRHKWYQVNSSSSAPSQNTSGHDLSDPEAQTVSVLPERERGTPYSRIFPEDPGGGSSRGGDGSKTSHNDYTEGDSASLTDFQGGADSTKQDETDDFLPSKHLAHSASFSGSVSWKQNSIDPSRLTSLYQKNNTKSMWSASLPQQKSISNIPWSSPQATSQRHAASAKFGKLQRCLSDTMDRMQRPPDNFLPLSQERGSVSPVEHSEPYPGHVRQQASASSTSSAGHNSGHLIFSGDGTILWSFGRDVRHKWEQDDDGDQKCQTDH